jgi:FAD/FMN-containing dehydrogenase
VDVIAELVAAIGPQRVVQGEAVPDRNRHDWIHFPPTLPRALLLPESTEQVAEILRICHRHGQSVVPQGGMTGLAAGGHPDAADICLSLERMSGIEELDPASATLTALAGTPLHVLQEAADAAGFAVGIDLGARGSCSIGGNVATNAGGNNVLHYGMTRQNLRGLEVVLADGTILRALHKLTKNNAGYDWTQLFIGSEGTLGVITRVVVALHPRLGHLRTALCAVADFDAALRVLRALERRLPGRLLAFEAMWHDFVAFAARSGRPCPLPDAPLVLLIDAAGDDDALGAALEPLLEDGTLTDAVLAKSDAERKKLWAVREAPAEYPRLLPGHLGFDVSIPLDRMAAAVEVLRPMLPERFAGAFGLFFGHVADSNLHILVAHPDGRLDKPAVDRAVYDIVAGFGGSISAEHGIGRSKRDFLAHTRSPAEIALMTTLKQALDPRGILNPGKVLMT